MARPSFFLVCSVKTSEMKRRIVVPVPLVVFEELLETAVSIWGLACRFKPELRSKLDAWGPVHSTIKDVPRLISGLRREGPFTMVQVFEPQEGVEVTIRLV